MASRMAVPVGQSAARIVKWHRRVWGTIVLTMVPHRDLLSVLNGVARRLADDHSLDTLARRSGWSKYHLHRGIRRSLGETPKRYTLRLRLERAAALLVSGSEPVLSIAIDTGFSRSEVFVRAFRQRYGCTPTAYRERGLPGATKAQRERHCNMVRAVGPCIGLFRTNPAQHARRPVMSNPTIEHRVLDAQPVLFIQRRVVQAEIQPLFAECFPKLYGHCQQAGIAMAGQPVARYVATGAGLWTIDCAIPLAAAAPGEGDMQAGELQSGAVAFAVHAGPYDQLAQTHAAIERWIEANGLVPNGPPWEVYVTDPTEHPDPADWRTEVCWPVAG